MADAATGTAGEGSGSPARVAVCQIALEVGQLDANREAAEAAITEAARQGADIVVLPELTNSGYVFASRNEALSWAERLDGPTVQAWTGLAATYGLVIVGGIAELDDQDVLRNSGVIVDASGLRAVYRKAHLWDAELEFFTAGSEPPPVVETSVGRVSLLICYDVEFPEWVRIAALEGAELLCVPTNWPVLEPQPQAMPIEAIRVMANANMNRIFIAVAARVGAERGVEWVGASGVASPDGAWLVDSPADVGVVSTTIDVGDARNKWTSDRNHQLSDRRPELYGALARLRGTNDHPTA
jgi:predicted amidohydrolase